MLPTAHLKGVLKCAVDGPQHMALIVTYLQKTDSIVSMAHIILPMKCANHGMKCGLKGA